MRTFHFMQKKSPYSYSCSCGMHSHLFQVWLCVSLLAWFAHFQNRVASEVVSAKKKSYSNASRSLPGKPCLFGLTPQPYSTHYYAHSHMNTLTTLRIDLFPICMVHSYCHFNHLHYCISLFGYRISA